MGFPEPEGGERRYVLLFACLIACLAGIGLWVWEPWAEPETAELVVVEETGAETTAAAPSGQIEVYISGAVKHPGVYDVPAGSRVYELVRAAGDVIPYADVEAVNLSARLSDGEKIHIPLNPARVTVTAEPVVNINQAGLEELETLPGIGEATARKILDYRQEHGWFWTKEELMEVPSIGEGRYGKIEDRITL